MGWGSVAMATPEAMVEEISKLSVEQLRQVKEQVDGEVSVLQDSLTNIRTAASRFEMASKALHMLSDQPLGRVRGPLSGNPVFCQGFLFRGV